MHLFQQSAQAWRNLGFFAMALIVHIALLMLPIKAWQTNKPPGEPLNQSLNEPITVHLQAAQKALSETVEPKTEAQAPVTDQTPPTLVRKPAAEYTLAKIPPPSDNLVPEERQASETSTDKTLNTQQLRQWVEKADGLAPPQEASRALGTAKSYRPPANWSRNAGAAFFASFDDRSHEPNLPADVTVVDRWQAADGSHQVVVQLPTGESMCGRAEAYNPMQPLVEHIMMFRICGRTPTFTMPERFSKGR